MSPVLPLIACAIGATLFLLRRREPAYDHLDQRPEGDWPHVPLACREGCTCRGAAVAGGLSPNVATAAGGECHRGRGLTANGERDHVA